MTESLPVTVVRRKKKKTKPYNSRTWLQAGAQNTAFIATNFSDSTHGSWFDAGITLADCSRQVTIHALGNDSADDKLRYIKKLRVITDEIDKLIGKIESSLNG
jgi:hypothetical protein